MVKHPYRFRRSSRAVMVLLVGVLSVPMVIQILIGERGVQTAELVTLFQADMEAIRQSALDNRETIRMQRRAYTRAVDRCQDRLRNGEQVTCPRLDTPSTYLPVTEKSNVVEQKDVPEKAVKPAAPASASVRDLTTEQRLLLRTYTRAGFCSKTAGVLLYKMCMDMLGERADNTAPVGIQNDNVKLHSRNRVPRPRTINDYLKVLDDSLSNPKRDSVYPTGYQR